LKNLIQHNYLTLPLAQGWEDSSQVIALGPEQGGFRANLVFSQETANFGESSTEFAERQLPELRKALPNYAEVEGKTAAFGPNSGYLRHHTFSMDQSSVGQLQFYCLIAGRAYTFTFTDLAEQLKGSRPIAERMFASARIAASLPDEDDDF
jgi:hypothetical protein